MRSPRGGGFAPVLRAEWTKLRTVRGWVVTLVAAALVIVSLGLLIAAGDRASCDGGPNGEACAAVPVGPDGGAVQDRFSFVHQSLTGDGTITVRLTSLTGIITYPPPGHDEIVPAVVPWGKAGIMLKDGTDPGSAYAAVMLTGDHGARMQHSFTHDTAGRPGGASAASPRWLRLIRSGDTITGQESTDGARWTGIGSVRLDGVPDAMQVGLFVASPCDLTVRPEVGGSVEECRFTQATAVFDHVVVRGDTSQGAWSDTQVADDDGQTDWEKEHPNGLVRSGGTFTVSGSGDIAPLGDNGAAPIERTLTGTFAALAMVIVVAVMFVSTEYRRGLVRTTLLASPRRGRVLAAKAAVIGMVAVVVGLVGTAVAITLGTRVLRTNGIYVLPVSHATELRVVLGTAALMAVTAVLALAVAALLRRSIAAVTITVLAMVLPYFLAIGAIVPEGAADWLMRVTPAAGFAIQQSIPAYPQVVGHYAPSTGYYPLSPGAGFAVLCGYAALALGLAVLRLRRGDA